MRQPKLHNQGSCSKIFNLQYEHHHQLTLCLPCITIIHNEHMHNFTQTQQPNPDIHGSNSRIYSDISTDLNTLPNK